MGNIVCDVLAYFTYCPLCYVYGRIVVVWSELSGMGGKDYIICTCCGAKWHIKGGKWAKLVKTSIDGKGREFLEKKYDLEFWQSMAFKGLKEIPQKG